MGIFQRTQQSVPAYKPNFLLLDYSRSSAPTLHESTELAAPYSCGTVNHKMASSHRKEVYNTNTFILHAASLHQAFAHCGIFSTAATRRCTARVSVPSSGVSLSAPLPVIALVSHYLTNKLIGPRPILKRINALPLQDYGGLAPISRSYTPL